MIAISDDGRLTFRLYATDEQNTNKRVIDSLGEAGQIIPDEAFYDLHAEDVYGREWCSERFLPDIQRTASGKAIVYGYLYDISSKDEYPAELDLSGSSIAYWVFDNIDIPANEVTASRQSIAKGQVRSRLDMLNAWRFKSCEISFLAVRETDDLFTIRASLSGSEPSGPLPARIIEAFQFVLGRPMHWIVMRIRRGHAFSTTIRSRRNLPINGRFHPPLPPRLMHHQNRNRLTAEFHRRLFDRFLRHTLGESAAQSALWGMLQAIQEASSANFIDADALTLTVVIESLLHTEFPDLGVLDEDDKAAIGQLKEQVESWKCKQRLKDRIRGCLDTIVNTRAIDMRALVDNGVITQEQRKAWQDLRNPSTHTYQSSGKPTPELLNLLQKVQVLFYHLLFAVIGYKGPYTDFASPGWPLRKFPERTSWL